MRRPILAALSAALLLAGAPVAAAKTLVFCSEGNPESLNPQLVTSATGIDAGRPMFDYLVEFKPGTTQLEPALAESWTISEDGRTYTFRLRDNVQFQSNDAFAPTRPLTSEDVVFSLERQWKPDHPFHSVGNSRFDYFTDIGMGELLESIEAPDERTVRIRLTRPEAPFLADLALPFNSIMSAEYAAAMMKAGTPGRVDTQPIGTGPFRLDSYMPEVAVRFRAFEGHWRGRPAIDTLVFSITPTPAARLTKLKSGECHVSAFPSPADAAQIEADPRLRLLKENGFNVGYLALNTSRPPFDDVRVRRALNYAIDKDAIIQAVFSGMATAAKNPMPPTLWGYDDEIQPYPYDPAAARRLFEEAGLTGGVSADLWYIPISRPYSPDSKRIASMIADDLETLGVRVDLKTQDWNTYRESLMQGEPDAALYGWTGDTADPDNFMSTLLSCTAARVGGNNIARWCDKRFDALVTEAKSIPDQERRTFLYKQAQRIFHDEAPWVPIAHSLFLVAIRKEVANFTIDPRGYHDFSRVDLLGGN
ncbi:ABC transporter substrate-binding protein [Antarcticirhabdus aurantiaca]|uniref:ABC transporter substrate-binding protein n=1 Tax=Antarcticirhabdus aurantiaca TaxID=2606717 RepID=A0ACD4NTT1_9HYPH|nr:ABC transporter substrate-binding protein [Antarcticirhabdus aurantiaca]WAJ30445.1 ABC transporter substrate-binding protein [Jeongeuplla avenae]